MKFVGSQLYALEAGAGCSHGLVGTDNMLLRVNANGTTTPIANLSEFQRTHPVANPEPDSNFNSESFGYSDGFDDSVTDCVSDPVSLGYPEPDAVADSYPGR